MSSCLLFSQGFFTFESLALSFVQAILLMRTLALWNNYPKVRYAATTAWLVSSGIHFVVSLLAS